MGELNERVFIFRMIEVMSPWNLRRLRTSLLLDLDAATALAEAGDIKATDLITHAAFANANITAIDAKLAAKNEPVCPRQKFPGSLCILREPRLAITDEGKCAHCGQHALDLYEDDFGFEFPDPPSPLSLDPEGEGSA